MALGVCGSMRGPRSERFQITVVSWVYLQVTCLLNIPVTGLPCDIIEVLYPKHFGFVPVHSGFEDMWMIGCTHHILRFDLPTDVTHKYNVKKKDGTPFKINRVAK